MRTRQAHEAVAAALKDGDWAVDATAGNGHDTLFLAQRVGTSGKVWAFDVQAQALGNTRQRLQEAGVLDRVSLVAASHAGMQEQLPDQAESHLGAVMFNLGYLPGSDKRIVTTAEQTLRALDQSLMLLRPGGVLTVLVYRGHPGGHGEWQAVNEWQQSLDCPVQILGDASEQAVDPVLLVIRPR